jgi:dTDP-4-dehydrorhamnose reductase
MAAPRLLVTGASGQVGGALCALAGAAGFTAIPATRPALDFDRPETIDAVFAAAAADLVVNAAAWTAVDAAEDAADAAMRANAAAPGRLAALCAGAGVPLIHISTDYVFDGAKGAPYLESDPTNPQGVYGASKLAGEEAVLESGAPAVILRTAWVHAARGKNFLRTILFAAARRPEPLRVVADQLGNPTAAGDLAAAILAIAGRLAREGWDARFGGVFHAAGAGATSWHGFATAIVAEAARHGLCAPMPEPIGTADWPTRAPRPADSRLVCDRLAKTFGVVMPPWQEGMARHVREIFAAGEVPARP